MFSGFLSVYILLELKELRLLFFFLHLWACPDTLGQSPPYSSWFEHWCLRNGEAKKSLDQVPDILLMHKCILICLLLLPVKIGVFSSVGEPAHMIFRILLDLPHLMNAVGLSKVSRWGHSESQECWTRARWGPHQTLRLWRAQKAMSAVTLDSLLASSSNHALHAPQTMLSMLSLLSGRPFCASDPLTLFLPRGSWHFCSWQPVPCPDLCMWATSLHSDASY